MQEEDKPFEQTPEANEYLNKLQSGRAQIIAEATSLEHESLKNLMQAQKRMRDLTTQRSDTEKEIEALQQRVKNLSSQIDLAAGEGTGYAKLLVSAEGARHAEAKAEAEAAAEAAETEAAEAAPTPEAVPVEVDGVEPMAPEVIESEAVESIEASAR